MLIFCNFSVVNVFSSYGSRDTQNIPGRWEHPEIKKGSCISHDEGKAPSGMSEMCLDGSDTVYFDIK